MDNILAKRHPLSADQISKLEKRIIENQEAFIYLDEDSDICYALPCSVDLIKDLAWHHASELTVEENMFVKRLYKKSGIKTYYLDGIYKKETLEDSWVLESVESTNFVLADGLVLLTKDNLIFKVKE